MSDEDPFAVQPDPADEPPFEPDTPTAEPGGPTPPADDFHPYKFTFKSGDSYADTWFTAAYRTLEEAEAELDKRGKLFASVLEKGAKVGKYFNSLGGGTSSRQSSGGGGGAARKADPAVKEPPAWAKNITPTCTHGPVYATAMKRDQSGYWHKYKCPVGECADQWLNPPKG